MELAPTAAPAVKGAIPECLDAMSRHRNARQMLTRLQRQIEGLRGKSFEGLTGVFAKYLFAPIYRKPKLSQALTDYLDQHWFDHSSGAAYFPELQPIAPLYA